MLIFFASRAMLVMLGLDEQWLPGVTFVTGIIAICYSSLGGLRAVVITDLFQFLLLFGGATLVVITVTVRLGGLGVGSNSMERGGLGHATAVQFRPQRAGYPCSVRCFMACCGGYVRLAATKPRFKGLWRPATRAPRGARS